MPAQRPGHLLCPSFPNGPAWPRASLVPTRPASGCKGAGLPADARLPHLSSHRSGSESHQALPRSPGKGVSGAHVQEGLSDSGKIYGSTDAPESAAAPRKALPGWVQQEKLVMLRLCPWHTTPHASRTARRFSLSLGRGKAFAAAGPHPHPPGPEGQAQSRGAATLAPEAPTVWHSPCSGCTCSVQLPKEPGPLSCVPIRWGFGESRLSFPLSDPSRGFSQAGVLLPPDRSWIFQVYFLPFLLAILAPAPAKGLPLPQLPPTLHPHPIIGPGLVTNA